MEMKPMTDEPTTQPSYQYQPLQMEQHSKDSNYQDIVKQKQAESEYKLTQQLPNVYQSLERTQRQRDEGLSTAGGPERDDIKADIKKMKIILLVIVTVNIVVLILLITAAILGSVLIQSKFEQVVSRQHLSISQINELSVSTKEDVQDIIDNISHLSMETYNNISLVSLQLLHAVNNDIGELTALTYHNISLILMHVIATNDNVTSALRQLDTNQGHITTHLDAAYSNMTSVQTHITNLQEYVTSLQMQVRYLHPCGPGEWRRVAYLNMSYPSQQCPSTWREYNTSGVRACGRPAANGASCAGVVYSNDNEPYSRVCGKAIGYQFGTPDAFGHLAQGRTIDWPYVYGVSFTHGSPRTHIWTLAAGLSQNGDGLALYNCPCTTPSSQEVPSFVGSDFYCESGNPTSTTMFGHLYSEDPLWDGEQCEGECCSNGKSPPWFSVELQNPTSDNIEVRICCGQGTQYDDVLVQLLEIYVQ